jgi:glycosyltransferase involved in cell wall biosynthesis
MRILFLHQSFPSQFGQLALELTRRYGWQCSFIVQSLGDCPRPSPEMLEALPIQRFQPRPRPEGVIPWQQTFAVTLDQAQAVLEAVRALPSTDFDLVVAHPNFAPTLFLPEVLRCPLVLYCEYYHGVRHRDLTYRVDLPPAELAAFYPRCVNAPILSEVVGCTGGYAPTRWQKETFPQRFWPKIEVHFDGLDTSVYRPQAVAPERAAALLAGHALPPGTRLVTYVARGLESMRGFDLFMDVAGRIAAARPDVFFVVVGSDKSCYAWDRLHTGSWSFKDWVLQRGTFDLSRLLFLAPISPQDLAEVLALSDLHIYLTVPFVLSWSLFDALACGCTVLAGDVAPVREVVTSGQNGLLEPLLDTERLADTALRVLADPQAFRPLGKAGRALIEQRYSLEVAVPELKNYFERLAAGNREPGS